jgi:hypothetical protein
MGPDGHQRILSWRPGAGSADMRGNRANTLQAIPGVTRMFTMDLASFGASRLRQADGVMSVMGDMQSGADRRLGAHGGRLMKRALSTLWAPDSVLGAAQLGVPGAVTPPRTEVCQAYRRTR